MFGEKGEKCNLNDLGNDSKLSVVFDACVLAVFKLRSLALSIGFSLFMACHRQSVNDHSASLASHESMEMKKKLFCLVSY